MINFDAVYKILSILDSIENEESYSDNTWNDLLEDCTYKELYDLNSALFNRQYFNNILSSVFGKKTGNNFPNEDKSIEQLIFKFKVLKENGENIIHSIDRLKNLQTYSDSLSLISSMIPKIDNILIPDIYYSFLPINSYAFISNNNEIIIDILLPVLHEKFFLNVVSHELFHLAFNSHTVINEDYIYDSDPVLFKFIVSFPNEGIANLFTAPSLLNNEKKIYYHESDEKSVIRFYSRANEIICEINDVINSLNSPDLVTISYEIIRILGTEKLLFHIFGFFIAESIWDYLGKEKIYECVINPLKFFEYYNISTKTNNKALSLSDIIITSINGFNSKNFKNRV